MAVETILFQAVTNIFDSVCASAIIIIGEVSDFGREQMPAFKDASVEVHYRPIYLRNWFVDKKLARYISSMYAHFFSSRNSFKQFID